MREEASEKGQKEDDKKHQTQRKRRRVCIREREERGEEERKRTMKGREEDRSPFHPNQKLPNLVTNSLPHMDPPPLSLSLSPTEPTAAPPSTDPPASVSLPLSQLHTAAFDLSEPSTSHLVTAETEASNLSHAQSTSVDTSPHITQTAEDTQEIVSPTVDTLPSGMWQCAAMEDLRVAFNKMKGNLLRDLLLAFYGSSVGKYTRTHTHTLIRRLR